MLVPVVGLLVRWAISFLKWSADREQRTRTSLALGLGLVNVAGLLHFTAR
jgi:hypothetical protein